MKRKNSFCLYSTSSEVSTYYIFLKTLYAYMHLYVYSLEKKITQMGTSASILPAFFFHLVVYFRHLPQVERLLLLTSILVISCCLQITPKFSRLKD